MKESCGKSITWLLHFGRTELDLVRSTHTESISAWNADSVRDKGTYLVSDRFVSVFITSDVNSTTQFLYHHIYMMHFHCTATLVLRRRVIWTKDKGILSKNVLLRRCLIMRNYVPIVLGGQRKWTQKGMGIWWNLKPTSELEFITGKKAMPWKGILRCWSPRRRFYMPDSRKKH